MQRQINTASQGSDRVEITPRMLAAGLTIFLDYDTRFGDCPGDLVSEIYAAMAAMADDHPRRENL
jgi:hypothetical protein